MIVVYAVGRGTLWTLRTFVMLLGALIRLSVAVIMLGLAAAGAAAEWAPWMQVRGYGRLSIGEINQLCGSTVGGVGQSVSGSVLRACGAFGLGQVLAIAAIPVGLVLAALTLMPRRR